ncbi:U11/U12 small nuclear ribonucleoprotein 48 kDa protein isoform 4-T5 [Liasis olivaceus]
MVSPLNLGEIEARVPFPKMAAAADSPVGKSLLSFSLWFGTPYEKVTCPYDANHQMPKSSLEKHMISCRLRKLEYSKEEEAEMYDSSFFYEKGKIPKVQMDKDLQFDIIKKAMAKECGNYCPETKNQRSRSQMTENDSDLFVDLAAKVNQDDGQKGPKSHLEILAEMRDYKRRRQSYRAKNVHITKKSYTEVIRDVIGVHMEELATHWQEENRNTEVHEDEKSSFSAKSSGSKEERRSASADSRQSCGSSKDIDYSRHRRNSSRSPGRRKRSRERERERDSRRKRERDEGKHRKRRK